MQRKSHFLRKIQYHTRHYWMQLHKKIITLPWQVLFFSIKSLFACYLKMYMLNHGKYFNLRCFSPACGRGLGLFFQEKQHLLQDRPLDKRLLWRSQITGKRQALNSKHPQFRHSSTKHEESRTAGPIRPSSRIVRQRKTRNARHASWTSALPWQNEMVSCFQDEARSDSGIDLTRITSVSSTPRRLPSCHDVLNLKSKLTGKHGLHGFWGEGVHFA